MGIVVIGSTFVDIKGFPQDVYIPDGRNVGNIEYVHGGVSRNVAEDIANVELRPTYVGIVDNSPLGDAVIQKLQNHKVNTDYVLSLPDGMGTWLAIFDNNGDVVGSISQRPNMMPLLDVLEEKGAEIFENADSIIVEVDLDSLIIKKALQLCEKYNKKIYGVVSNMSIAAERRDLMKRFNCVICNQLEAGILFADDYSKNTPEELCDIVSEKAVTGNFPSIIVTMGAKGAVYADCNGLKGICPAKKIQVKDTTGAGDAFFAGVVIGLTYGKDLASSAEIGTALAASVITSSENVCPRFHPKELGLDIEIK
ncbi:MAG: carbohydrate kinase family protein [Clostridiales bacterium]|nr:carbohydrate kinase family protein [Clostridiales bacterium]